MPLNLDALLSAIDADRSASDSIDASIDALLQRLRYNNDLLAAAVCGNTLPQLPSDTARIDPPTPTLRHHTRAFDLDES